MALQREDEGIKQNGSKKWKERKMTQSMFSANANCCGSRPKETLN
jgi:hypothetical protein